MRPNGAIVTILLTLTWQLGRAFEAYQCDGVNLPQHNLDLRQQPKGCPDPQSMYKNLKPARGQILQTNARMPRTLHEDGDEMWQFLVDVCHGHARRVQTSG